MLILSRNCGKSIVIGDEITITVVGVNGSQVRLGIVAPQDVSVHRKEIHSKIKEKEKKIEPEDGEGDN